ncbi:MAG: C-terminal binding protein [Oscillospiraceae bacterium]
MKIVLTIVPFQLDRKDKNWTIERSCLPPDSEFIVTVFDKNSDNNDAFYKEISDADIIINSYVYFGKKEIDALKKCKIISFQCTGYNEVDLKYAEEKGIAVSSILDYCTQETAENSLALMLVLQRKLRIYDRSIQVDKEWNYSVASDLERIEGQTMGIVGLGRIGQSVARKAKGFDMNVIAYDPFLPPEIAEGIGVKLVDFDTLLAESDVISVHMNATDDNHHMFNKEVFAKCKKKPILINEGRGSMISEDALVWALDEGLVRAAGLDMLESENPDLTKCKLLGRDNVIITPHCGYFSNTSEYLVHKLSMVNGISYVNGEYDKVKVLRNNVKR